MERGLPPLAAGDRGKYLHFKTFAFALFCSTQPLLRNHFFILSLATLEHWRAVAMWAFPVLAAAFVGCFLELSTLVLKPLIHLLLFASIQ